MKKRYLVTQILFLFGMQLCALTVTNVPDAVFRGILSSKGITFDGSNNITNPETAAAIISLDLSLNSISDLSGIEAFTGLKTLDCSANQLTDLNISSNTNLEYLLCYSNQLTELDVLSNVNLKLINCYDNNLTSLDVSTNINLQSLYCSINDLESLNVSNNLDLRSLECNENNLTSIDVSNNIKLQGLYLMSNQINSLDISANELLTIIDIRNNPTPFTLSVWELPFPLENISLNDTDPESNKVLGSLPVELSFFAASANGNKFILNWATATETNNSGWEIEYRSLQSEKRSQNIGWKNVGFVAGKGTTTEKQTYTFSVSVLTGSNAEFRLKQIDTDGKVSYSNVLTGNLVPSRFELLQNYPNPFNPTTEIKYSLPVSGHVELSVYNMLGQKIMTLVNGEKEAGYHNFSLNGKNMVSGSYFYSLDAANFHSTKKFVLLK